MGYRPTRTTYVLDFGDRYDGLEVKVRAGTLGNMLRIQTLSAKGEEMGEAETEEMFVRFASLLAGWNIEDDDGTPVPATLDGLKGLEPGLAMEIMRAAGAAIGGVAAPLENGSADGGPSAVESLPTVPLSPSPPS